jgi:hypothetical protein
LRNAPDYQRALRASVLSSIAIEGVKKAAERALTPTRNKQPAKARYPLNSVGHFFTNWKLRRWSTPEMVQKYAHLSSEHLAQWVDRRSLALAEDLPESGTFFTTTKEKGLSISA